MRFYEKLYMSTRIRSPRQVKRDLLRGKGNLLIYVLVLAKGPEGIPQLEFMHSANLQQRYYRENPPLIIGIAQGREDAIQMVEQITIEAYHMTGEWNAAAYLESVVLSKQRRARR